MEAIIELIVDEVVRLQLLHMAGPGWWLQNQCNMPTGNGICGNIRGHEGPHWKWTTETWQKACTITEYAISGGNRSNNAVTAIMQSGTGDKSLLSETVTIVEES